MSTMQDIINTELAEADFVITDQHTEDNGSVLVLKVALDPSNPDDSLQLLETLSSKPLRSMMSGAVIVDQFNVSWEREAHVRFRIVDPEALRHGLQRYASARRHSA